MKYLIVVPDGSADDEVASLGGKTPLEVSNIPNINELAQKSIVGMVRTIPPGIAPGSDAANLGLMGYDARTDLAGRSPLEVISIGIEMEPSDVAFRANFITVKGDCKYEDMTIINHDAGCISSEESDKLIRALNEEFESERIKYYTGTQYRHCLLVHGGRTDYVTVPPHDHLDKRVGDWLPQGEDADFLIDMMRRSYDIMNEHPVNRRRREQGMPPANSLWIWGQGKRPNLMDFGEKYGVKGSVISAIDLIRGIAMYAGLGTVIVPGATGSLDTNYEGKAEAALNLFDSGNDFVYVHVEGPDESSHAGSLEDKIKCIENIDSRIVKPIVEGLRERGEEFRVLIAPDHRTPLAIRTHSSDPVPFVLYDSRHELKRDESKAFNEHSAAATGVYVDEAFKLTDIFFEKRSL
ncbi:MAG: cofactor-independent phosphoglycerate mutase [Eubacterium sp.]|nr:cofactor-independent phosphoglycerate mutase [Eubacterium sp.]